MKRFLFCLIFAGCILLTGCGNSAKSNSDDVMTMTCSKFTESSGYTLDAVYNVTYSGENVTYINTVEKVISDNSNILNAYKQQVSSIYSPYKDVKYYDYDVSIDGDTMTSITNIDYSKIDYMEMIKVDSNNATLFQNGKLKLSTIKTLYSTLGVECDK